MKVLINLIILIMVAAGGAYFYEQNKEELNKTLDEAKNISIGSVSETIAEKVNAIDTDNLIEFASKNKEMISELMGNNEVNLENMDMEALKEKLNDSGINLEGIDLNDAATKEKLQEAFNSLKE